jgi:hypothetical protein
MIDYLIQSRKKSITVTRMILVEKITLVNLLLGFFFGLNLWIIWLNLHIWYGSLLRKNLLCLHFFNNIIWLSFRTFWTILYWFTRFNVLTILQYHLLIKSSKNSNFLISIFVKIKIIFLSKTYLNFIII